jgi:tetratricopeptide (TPR) repeat protein
VLAVIAVTIGWTSAVAASSPLSPRQPIDEQELARMRMTAPSAADAIAEGEVLVEAGALDRADALFAQAESSYPAGALASRRRCEIMTAWGLRQKAVEECSRAMQSSHSNPNVRALVRALVDGPQPPTSSDLVQAWLVVSSERDRAPGQLTPIAAGCDVAARMGDEGMLQRCAEELERIAPTDPDTLRVKALLASRCPPLRFWTGWLAVLAAIALTVGHALRRKLVAVRRPAAVAAGALVALLAPAISRAEPSGGLLSKWPVDDAHPESSIPSDKDRNADPLEFGYWLQDVALKAERASGRGDHAAAAAFYGALAHAVPDRAVGFVKMCDEYEALGDRQRAIDACAAALLRNGLTLRDYTHFVDLELGRSGALPEKDVGALRQVISHMRQEPNARDVVDDVECRVGVRISDEAMLDECTAALAARSPDSPATISYEWALAMQKGQLDEAERQVGRAKAAGMPDVGVAEMRQATEGAAARRRWRIVLALAAVALLLAGGFTAARAFIRRRLRLQVPAQQPAG